MAPRLVRIGEEWGRSLQRGINAGLEPVPVRLDTGQTARQLVTLNRSLDRLDGRAVKVEVKVDVAGSMAELAQLVQVLDRLDGRRINININADAAAALASLLLVDRELSRVDGQRAHAGVDVDVGGALASLFTLRTAMLAVGTLGGPQLAAVGAGIVGLAGPLAGAAAGFGGLAAVAVPAISHVRESLEQEAQASKASGAASQQASQQAFAAASARQQLSAAVRNAAFAHRQALEQVRSAELQVADAQRQAQRAQDDLNRARGEARRQLQDLANNLADARLDERQAAFDVADAEKELARLRADPKATKDQLARQQLAVDRAKQQQKEQHLTLVRLVQDERAARKAGVEGSDQVRAARDRLHEANRRIGESERALSNARANVARVDQQSADQIASARRALAQASQRASTATGGLTGQLVKLTPLERQLAVAWKGLTGAFNEWARALQPAVLPLLIKGIGLLRGLLPTLTPIVLSAAKAVDGLLDSLAAGLKSPFFQQFAADLARWAGPAITLFGQITGNLIIAVAGIARAFAPIGFAFLNLINRMTAAFASFAVGLTSNPAFQRFSAVMIQALDNIVRGWSQLGPLVAPILGGLLTLLFKVGVAIQDTFRPLFAALLPVLGVVVGAVSRVVVALVPAITAIGRFLASLVSGLLPLVGPIIDAVGTALAELAGQLTQALQQAMPSLQQLVMAVGSLLPALKPLIPLIPQLLGALLPLLPLVAQLSATMATSLVPVLRLMANITSKVIVAAFSALIFAVKGVVAYLKILGGALNLYFKAWGVIIQAAGAVALWLWEHAVRPAFRFIATLAKWLYSIVAFVVIAPLIIQFKVLAAIVTWLWKNVFGPGLRRIVADFRDMWAKAKPIINALGTGIRWVWRTFVQPAFDAMGLAVRKLSPHFRNAVDAIRREWDKLRAAAKGPVSFVVNTIFNSGLVKIWDAVAKLVPGMKRLEPIRGFAAGGVLPGYAPGRDRLLAAVSPGESIFRPEFTKAVGEKFVTGANAAARSGGVSGVVRYLGMAGDPGMPPGFAGHFKFGGIVGGFLKAAKGWFAGGLVKVATKAFNPLVASAQKAIGGTGFGDLAVNAVRGLTARILGYFKPLESKIGGGSNAVVRAARTQLGVPYVWGGTSWNHGLDCSGLTSQAWLRGARKWIGRTTYAQYPASRHIEGPRPAALGFPHMGHVVLASKPGHIIEAPYTGARVREVPISRHYEWRWPNAAAGLKFDTGGWLPTGTSLVYNGTGAPEPVLTNAQLAALGNGSSGGTVTEYHAHLDGMTRAAYEQQVRAAFTAMQVQAAQRDRTGRRR
ncbi:phage-related protein [Actinomadura pelletieri DSM 43383]|uniref:Phage-related protein n=1 Tax=Actinomadura pelletieri DSM 43383 TaxID=1120940 RepID=A0A495QSK1_9ACTN|nr:NlpC/P60 family protein [Actinomadura pelletieri]RKS76485.1 phage-related protein [Actinomadura pelletieri DSM 43383]